jgi:hypothetical protein
MGIMDVLDNLLPKEFECKDCGNDGPSIVLICKCKWQLTICVMCMLQKGSLGPWRVLMSHHVTCSWAEDLISALHALVPGRKMEQR